MTGPFYLEDGGPSTSPSWATDGTSIVTATLHLVAVAGFCTGIRYYAGDTGTQVTLRLWEGSASPLTDGTALATTTHTADSTGWHVGLFDEPVPIDPAVPYVAARSHPSHFGIVGSFFSAAHGALTEADPVYAPGNADDISALLGPEYEAGWGGQGAANGRFVEPAADPTLWPLTSGNGAYFAVDLEFYTELPGGDLVDGSGVATLGGLTATGAGRRIVKGLGASLLGGLAVAGVGKRIVNGSGAATLGGLIATGVPANSTIVPRPFTGTTARPDDGTITRPTLTWP